MLLFELQFIYNDEKDFDTLANAIEDSLKILR